VGCGKASFRQHKYNRDNAKSLPFTLSLTAANSYIKISPKPGGNKKESNLLPTIKFSQICANGKMIRASGQTVTGSSITQMKL
jgi:hypothetical protein